VRTTAVRSAWLTGLLPVLEAILIPQAFSQLSTSFQRCAALRRLSILPVNRLYGSIDDNFGDYRIYILDSKLAQDFNGSTNKNKSGPESLTMYPMNAWYVACTPDEIADKPLGRQICGEKMV
ncbi:hypothetical protein, partial [Pandoraea sputorum]|uniref:hypothetical protein n=1 Tax=Pandoraea sputorum TaxID=93222 RepID=UPI0035569D67